MKTGRLIQTTSGFYCSSNCFILLTRFSWRPPSNSVSKKCFTISLASPGPMTRSPMASMFALLCWRVAFALNTSCTNAQRIPFTLLGGNAHTDSRSANEQFHSRLAFSHALGCWDAVVQVSQLTLRSQQP